MIWFLLAAFFIVLAIVFFAIGAVLRKRAEDFSSEMRRGKAVVEGYQREEKSSWYTLLVRLPEFDGGKTVYGCNAGRIHIKDYPKGKIVDVYYAKGKTLGINTVKICLIENMPTDGKAIAKVFRVIGLCGLILGIAFCVVGIMTLL